MKLVNDKLKNALKKTTTQRKGQILVNNQRYDIYNVEYYADCYDEGKVIGNAIASQLTFDIPVIEKFDKFTYFDGVWTGTKYEYVDMGEFVVFDDKNNEDFTKHITAFDNLIKFNAPFEDKKDYPKSLKQELINVCNQAGVKLENITIPNANFIVENNQFVEGDSLKAVLKAICGITGTYALIKNNKIKLQLKGTDKIILNKSEHTPVTWKRPTYGINQVIIGMKDVEGEYVLKEDIADIQKNGVHKLVINDNKFAYTQAKREALIDELFNQVKGFGYIPYELSGEWLNYAEIGDLINIDGTDSIVLRINGKSPKAIKSEISAPAIIDSSIDYVDNTDTIENKVKRTEIIVNKNTQEIDLLSKKIVDISTTEEGFGKIPFTNASKGALSNITITGDVQKLYPAMGQNGSIATKSGIYKSGMAVASSDKPYVKAEYPSATLFSKDSYLIIRQADKEDVIYHLPINHLNVSGNVSDEFQWNFGDMKIIRRVGVLPTGEHYPLATPYEETLGNLEIAMPEGDGEIIFKCYPNAKIKATYMFKNEYTETFSTKVETKSQIKVASDNINLEVAKKVDSDKVVSTINLSPEQIVLRGNRVIIDSTKFKLDAEGNVDMSGKLSLSDGKMVFDGARGLLTNLQFVSSDKFEFLGFEADPEVYDPSGHSVIENLHYNLSINAEIPENFEIVDAKLTLIHIPMYYISDMSGTTFWGWSKNIEANISSNLDNFYKTGILFGALWQEDGEELSQIYNAFGSGGFTAQSASSSNHKSQQVYSANIKDSLHTGWNRVVLKSNTYVPSSTDFEQNAINCAKNTGSAIAILNILGYTKFN